MKNKGITLVALVITIVILLILAGISIQAITNTGLFENAKIAAEESKYANAEEKVKLAVLASYDENASLNKDLLKDSLNKIDGINPKVTEVKWDLTVNVDGYEFVITEYGTVTCVGRKNQETLPDNTPENPQDTGKEVALKEGWGTQTVKYIKTSDGTEVTELETVSTVYAISVGNGETVPVPYGFYYVGGSINTGVIISDNEADKYDGKIDKTTHEYATKLKGNQFVWIPCTINEYKKIDFGMQSNGASWDRETNTAEEEQIEKYGGFYVGRYESGVSTLDEETGTFKDSVTFSNNESLFNAVGIQSGINGMGWQNYNFIARGKVITDSNYPNKATGNIVLKANSIPYYHSDYYTAVEMSRRLYSNNSYVQSGLITGTQWDMMMKFLSNSSDYSDMKSTNWGNYKDVSLSNLRGYYTNVKLSDGATDGFKSVEGFTTNAGSESAVLLTTGSTEQVLRKGLYDVAGNLWEWTQEASYRSNTSYNTSRNTYNIRSASFSQAYANYPASYRSSEDAPGTYTNRGFRPVLYIK